MLLRFLTVATLIIFLFSSCNDDNTDQYEGVWEGAFNGDKEGTWKIGIEDEGAARGVMRPSGEDRGFSINGKVNEDGELTMSANVLGRDILYEAFLTETTLEGNWSAQDDAFEGDWSGTKNEREERFPYGLILYP